MIGLLGTIHFHNISVRFSCQFGLNYPDLITGIQMLFGYIANMGVREYVHK